VPDLHDWITQHVNETEHGARAAAELQALDWSCPSTGVVDLGSDLLATGDRDVAYHVVRHDPAAVLRRCEADRRVLARHRLNPDAYWYDAAMCAGCGTEGEMDYARTENLNDCPELLDLAYAHGLTDEILATLDRPQEGERPDPRPGLATLVVAEQMYGKLWATVIGTRLVEPRPEAKALEILSPELKKITGYVPTAEDPPAT
jgi:hypothetical protein